MSMTVIVDYGMGNLRSVYNALSLLGAEVCISSQPEDILAAGRLILPGVGAFGMAMNNLRQRGLIDPLREKVMGEKVPFLAICLGMQLLAEEGLEHGRHTGLGWIQGQVIPFQKEGLGELRVPHVGWNEIQPKANNPLFKGLGASPEVYFVHSYHLITEDEDAVAATTHYGYPFASSLWRDNIFATQFHPEKSQGLGLNMLRNFLAYSPKSSPQSSK